MREKTKRLSTMKGDSLVNQSQSNPYDAYDNRPIGGGGMRMSGPSYDDFDTRHKSGSEKIIFGGGNPNFSMREDNQKSSMGKTTY
jgi:hypothetical protein